MNGRSAAIRCRAAVVFLLRDGVRIIDGENENHYHSRRIDLNGCAEEWTLCGSILIRAANLNRPAGTQATGEDERHGQTGHARPGDRI
jgi:hypothetical protein